MFDNLLIWYGIWSILFFVFAVILYKAKNRKLYFLYFIFGMIFGFYFDIFSFTFGYYSYPNFFPLTIFGIPFTMIIAEGFSVVITINIFEITKSVLRRSGTQLN